MPIYETKLIGREKIADGTDGIPFREAAGI